VSRQHHSLVREGFISGIIGAAVVAVWFLISDVLQGRPFSTPSVLGQVVLFQNSAPNITPAEPGPELAYPLLHLGAFVVFGILLSQLIHLAMSSPLARFGLMVIAVCFELFFVFMTYAVFHQTSYLFPWWSVLAANTLSLAGMGFYLYRRHPGLRLQYQREPLGG
jgi:hypothetical protein